MATPYADYKVAAVNENWQPLAGVEIEAMNLATLLADAIATTGLDGVASFSGLPAGPHFFRVRATRVSTKVGHRTFIGQIHLQVIAMGHQGIVKDAIVDKNGHGTHTTIQAAINSVLASGGSGYYVIHINPGLYQELLTVALGTSGNSLILEAQGEVKNLPGRTYNKVVRISQPAGQGTQNTLTLTGTGGLELRGLDIGSDISGHAVKVTGTAASLLVRDCDLHSVGGQAIQATINIAVLDSIIASDSSVAFGSAAGAATWLFSRCAIIGAPAISGDFNELAFDDCWLNFAGASSNYTIQESNLVVSQRLRMTGCNIAAGTLGGIYFGNASGNVSQDLIFVGNYIYGSGKAGTQKGITLVCVKGAVIVGNKFRSLGYGIYLMPVGGVTVQGLIVDGNSFDSVGVAIHADAGAMDTTDIIGPNAFQDVTTPYEGVPGSSLYTSHTLLDGVYHTDTLLGVVLDGDIIIGNVTPKWSRLAISIPAANVRNVLGIDNAELRPSWKTALDSTAPADIAAAGAAGTSLVFSHRDHVHAHPVFAAGDLHPEYTTDAEVAALIGSTPPAAHDLDGALHTGVSDYTSSLGLASLAIDDANFALDLVSSNPEMIVDAGDYLAYNRASNYFSFVPGATEIARFYAGGVTIGTGAAPESTVKLDVEGNALVYGNLEVTNDAAGKTAETTIGLSSSHGTTITTGGWTEMLGYVTANPAGASDAIYLGMAFYVATAAACAQNLTGYPGLQGLVNTVLHGGTGTVSYAFVSENRAFIDSSGTITNVYGLYSGLVWRNSSTSTVAAFRHIFIENAVLGAGPGVLTNQYGIFIQDMAAAANNYPIYFEGTSGLARQGIWWNADTNLYRSAANVLKTDDSFHSAINLLAAGYARVGSLAAPTNTTAGDLTAARGMFGDQVSFSSQRIFWAFRSITETAAVSSQVASVSAIVAPVGASSADIRVLAVGTDCQQGANTLNVIMGANFENYVRGTGTITLLEGARYTGVVALAGAGNTVNITSANCQSIYLFYRADSSTVVCGTLQGINITAAPGNGVAGDAWASIRGIHIGNLGGTRTTYAFGILLEKQSGATSMNVGVFSYGATTAVLWVYNDTPSEGAIKWGTAGDTNLYRSAANVLATDDSLYAALHARIGSVTAPTNITAGDLTCARLFVNDAAAVAGIDALITGDMAISSQLVVGAAAAAVAGRALEVRQASPAANETELWLGEGTPETVRQVKWMDPGALGVNFVGGEKVLVLV